MWSEKEKCRDLPKITRELLTPDLESSEIDAIECSRDAAWRPIAGSRPLQREWREQLADRGEARNVRRSRGGTGFGSQNRRTEVQFNWDECADYVTRVDHFAQNFNVLDFSTSCFEKLEYPEESIKTCEQEKENYSDKRFDRKDWHRRSERERDRIRDILARTPSWRRVFYRRISITRGDKHVQDGWSSLLETPRHGP